MEKKVKIRDASVTFSIWDLGGTCVVPLQQIGSIIHLQPAGLLSGVSWCLLHFWLILACLNSIHRSFWSIPNNQTHSSGRMFFCRNRNHTTALPADSHRLHLALFTPATEWPVFSTLLLLGPTLWLRNSGENVSPASPCGFASSTLNLANLLGFVYFTSSSLFSFLVIVCYVLLGQREFVNMLPLVCNEAAAILFMFDLSRKVTLASVKEWYRQARGFNKAAVPFLIGTKFDAFQELPEEEQEEITKQARKYAKLMKAPLLYCSAKDGVNVPKIFKVVLAKCFDLNCNLPTVSERGQPIFEY